MVKKEKRLMKKKLFPLIGGIVLLAALLGIYIYSSSSSNPGDETEPTTEQTSGNTLVNTGEYTLCDREAERRMLSLI